MTYVLHADKNADKYILLLTGFYDRKLGEWVTAPDGRVIRVLEGTATQRQVDVNGYYIPAIEQERMALGTFYYRLIYFHLVFQI